MIKKILTRSLIAAVIAVMTYFVMLSKDTVSVPIEPGETAREREKDLVRGKNFHYRSFDAKGNELVSGSSNKVIQTDETRFRLEDGFSVKINEGGKTYDIQADSLTRDENGGEVMTAGKGSIVLSMRDGIRIETAGPLIRSPDNIFSTKAEARFQLGTSSGTCRGLRYKHGEFLELQEDAVFKSKSERETVYITSDFITFDQALGRGKILHGVVSSVAVDGSHTTLTAHEIDLDMAVGYDGETLQLKQATLRGQPARFIWDSGSMDASEFEVCFDETGRWAEGIDTGQDAQFAVKTQDGYAFSGFSGRLSLRMRHGEPLLLDGTNSIHILGHKAGEPEMRLFGQEGVETRFIDGRAYNTRIKGAPVFEYGGQWGQAGSLQVLHNERNILFSEKAELLDRAEAVRIMGDKILLTNWDLKEREIFAFDFVEIIYSEDQPQMVRCLGDHLLFKLPAHYLKLEGKPAKALRENQVIEASQIEIEQIDDELYDLRSDQRVKLSMESEKGLLRIVAEKMDYHAAEQRLEFEEVIEGIIPELGTLSCGRLTARFRDRNDRKVMETVEASVDVILESSIEDEGERKPVTCRADRLIYEPAKGLAHFKGEGRDVAFDHPSSKLRGRELTYNLNDGSMRVDSVTHGTTQTTVNLKDRGSKEN